MTEAGRSGAAVRELLAEIEWSGSGSQQFWVRFWLAFRGLSDVDLRRVLLAVGDRAAPVRAQLAGVVPLPSARLRRGR